MSTSFRYEISGGDGGCYGPIFGPIHAREIAELATDGESYLVLELDDAIFHGDDQIDYFVVSPRHVGVSLRTLRREDCYVAVGRVLPDQIEALGTDGISNTTVEHWAIGVCKRSSPNSRTPRR